MNVRRPSRRSRGRLATIRTAAALAMLLVVGVRAQNQSIREPVPDRIASARSPGSEPEFAIGPEDVIGVLVWGEADLTRDLIVRPDGFITMPLLNDVVAAGRTPAQLKAQLAELLRAYVKEPNVTVIVREINSRKVSITGRVIKPGSYPILAPMRALDLIAKAGGLAPLADARHITVLRTDRGARISLPFDYTEVSRGIRVWQDIVLRPGDTLIVP